MTDERATDVDRMHRFVAEDVDLVLAYVRDRLALPEAPVDGLGDRTEIAQALTGLIGEDGKSVREVLDVYIDTLADTILSADSPRYYSFIPAAPTKASLLFDMVVSAASLQGCSWLEAAGAVAAEEQALRVMLDAAGMPSTAGGVFVSGGSAANLSALVVARDMAPRRLGREAPATGWRVVVSDQSHSSIARALSITGMRPLVVPTVDGRLDGAAIRAALADEAVTDDIAAIVATAGTTNAGIVDDLRSAATIAEHRHWWFHVDGAYGAAGLLVDRIRSKYDGIEQADSIVMDPHKWWFAPYDSAALLYREPWQAAAVHTQKASYLDVIHEDNEGLNPSDLAYHLTRRPRGMPLWFSMAVNGLQAYREAVERGLELAAYAADAIGSRPGLRLVRRPDLSVVLFEREGWSLVDFERWSRRLLESQVAFVAHSSWRGLPVGRMVFLHPGTTVAMIDEVLDTLM